MRSKRSLYRTHCEFNANLNYDKAAELRFQTLTYRLLDFMMIDRLLVMACSGGSLAFKIIATDLLHHLAPLAETSTGMAPQTLRVRDEFAFCYQHSEKS